MGSPLNPSTKYKNNNDPIKINGVLLCMQLTQQKKQNKNLTNGVFKTSKTKQQC